MSAYRVGRRPRRVARIGYLVEQAQRLVRTSPDPALAALVHELAVEVHAIARAIDPEG